MVGAGNSSAKLQVSLDFRVLSHDDGPRLDFDYTQTMFWAIYRPSSPIRARATAPKRSNGWKVAVTGRGNPRTGKGSAEELVSYPLTRIDSCLPKLYLFGQFFPDLVRR